MILTLLSNVVDWKSIVHVIAKIKKNHLFACFIHVNFLKYEYNTGTVNWIQVQFAV